MASETTLPKFERSHAWTSPHEALTASRNVEYPVPADPTSPLVGVPQARLDAAAAAPRCTQLAGGGPWVRCTDVAGLSMSTTNVVIGRMTKTLPVSTLLQPGSGVEG